ncbi:MAG: Holliday junction branch migration protein RuvA [Patescibacteria group bacterium]|nr:Holliday junction branch migration protein RuvA [bacterium]MDZ4240985.1 Holliday junction branch migration protein RuvA [Patescibacteria group bacterium]
MIDTMIGRLKGVVVYRGSNHLIIETDGIGYKVFVTSAVLSGISEEKEKAFWIHTAVRENAIDLYGFETREDIEFFEQLLTVQGIGPKSALSVLDAASVKTLKQGISLGDTSHLIKVSGIGKKSAEKIMLGLKDKFKDMEGHAGLENEIDALEALTALGYTQRDVRDAFQKIDANIVDTGEKVKEAMRILGSKRK